LVIATGLLLALAAQVSVAPAPKFDSGRAWEHLRQLVAIGPRPSGSPAIELTRKYIKDQLASDGLVPAEQTWDETTPIDKVRMTNLVVTIPGARKDRIIIAGHYDTKLSRQFRFVGASDGGSSAAFLLELARVLKSRHNAMTIDLVFLDGEEARLWDWNGNDNTYGSRHMVEQLITKNELKRVRAMILLDMMGFKDLRLDRPELSSRWLVDVVWQTARDAGMGGNSQTVAKVWTTTITDRSCAQASMRSTSSSWGLTTTGTRKMTRWTRLRRRV